MHNAKCEQNQILNWSSQLQLENFEYTQANMWNVAFNLRVLMFSRSLVQSWSKRSMWNPPDGYTLNNYYNISLCVILTPTVKWREAHWHVLHYTHTLVAIIEDDFYNNHWSQVDWKCCCVSPEQGTCCWFQQGICLAAWSTEYMARRGKWPSVSVKKDVGRGNGPVLTGWISNLN